MSGTLIQIITTAIVIFGCSILRWKRHFVMRWICPREIFFLEFAEDQNRICDRGFDASLKSARTWKIFFSLAIGFFVLTLGFIELTVARARLGQWSIVGVKAAAILCALIPLHLIPLMCLQYRKWMRVFLREYLNDHGILVCRNCGYDLRGRIHPRCPECGTAFASAEPAREKGEAD